MTPKALADLRALAEAMKARELTFGTALSWAEHMSPDVVLALLERAERLEAALMDLLADEFCPATSGGTEGKWCMNHDTPMADDNECWKVRNARAAFAAPTHPEEEG